VHRLLAQFLALIIDRNVA